MEYQDEIKKWRDKNGHFVKGNLFSIGIGTKPMYETPEDLAKAIAEYIEYCDMKKGNKDKGVYTQAGLALFLGFKSREALWHYGKREGFGDVIDSYKLFLTDWNEQKLYWAGTFMAAQFWLKNWGGYKDENIVSAPVSKVEIVEKSTRDAT